jgi:hypothetical protein
MSKIQRYEFEGVAFGSQCYESDEGGWVKYEDHAAALRAERANTDPANAAAVNAFGLPFRRCGVGVHQGGEGAG